MIDNDFDDETKPLDKLKKKLESMKLKYSKHESIPSTNKDLISLIDKNKEMLQSIS